MHNPHDEYHYHGGREGWFNWGVGNTRDALYLGNCDDGVEKLVDLIGWREEFDALLARGKELNGRLYLPTRA
eukprot:1175820-Prorocentrum_minimum.AAC.4